MPRLVRLYILQCLTGFGLATVFVGLLLWMNVANLAHLVTHTEAGMLAVFMLWLFNGLVFAGVQFAITIMRMEDRGEPPAGGRRIRIGTEPVRVPVEATSRDGARKRLL